MARRRHQLLYRGEGAGRASRSGNFRHPSTLRQPGRWIAATLLLPLGLRTSILSPASPGSFATSSSYGAVTYGKIGDAARDPRGNHRHATPWIEAMRTYFQRYRFTHPTTEDFLRTIEQVAVARRQGTVTLRPRNPVPHPALPASIEAIPPNPGPLASTTTFSQLNSIPLRALPPPCTPARPLPAALSEALTRPPAFGRSSIRPSTERRCLDYAVDGFFSEPVQWWQPAPRRCTHRRSISPPSTCAAKATSSFPSPPRSSSTMASRVREHWDGADRWTRFTYTRNAKGRLRRAGS